MDCHCNEQNARYDSNSNRRSNSCRQNYSSSRQRMSGNYYNSPRYSSNMNKMERNYSSANTAMSGDCGCRECPQESCRCEQKNRGCITNAMRATECMPLGMTYTPYQDFEALYEWNYAFTQGTLFEALDKPFLVTNCAQGGMCR